MFSSKYLPDGADGNCSSSASSSTPTFDSIIIEELPLTFPSVLLEAELFKRETVSLSMKSSTLDIVLNLEVVSVMSLPMTS